MFKFEISAPKLLGVFSSLLNISLKGYGHDFG